MNLLLLFLGIFGCIVVSYSYPPLPEWFITCKRQPHPQINDCIMEKSVQVLPHLLKGVKELKVPNFIPLKLKEVSVYNEGSFNLKLLDINLYGLESGKLVTLQFDLPGNQLDGRLSFNELQVNATYDIDGRVLILPIKGHGPGYLKLTGILIDAHVDWIMRPEEQFHLFEVTNLKVNYTVDSAFIHFENLFGGDKRMGEEMNIFVNENWQDFHESIRVGIEKMIETTALALIVNVVRNIPLENMFPV